MEPPNISATPAPARKPDVLDLPTAGAKVIRGGLLRMAGYLVTVLLGVAAAALLTRHLGVVDFGRYVTVVSLIAIAASVTDAGLANIGVREYSVREGESRDRFMRSLLGVRLAVTLAGAAVAVVFAAAAGYGEAMVLGTAVAGAALCVTTYQQTLSVSLAAELRLGWVSALDVVRQLAVVVLVAVLVAVGASLLPFLATPLPAALLVLALTVVLMRSRVPLKPAFQRAEWASLVRVVLPYAAASAVGALYGYLAMIVLSLTASGEETGYFGASFRVFLVIAGIPALLISSAFPVVSRAARDDQTRLAYATQRLWDVSLIVGAGLALCTIIGAGVAIDVVGGADYARSADVLRVQAIALLASFVFATWGAALLGLARYRGILVVNSAALVVSIVVTLTLAPEYGAMAGAVATVAGDSVLAIGYAVVLMHDRRDLRVSPALVPRVALACAAAAAVVLVPGLPDAVTVALAAVVYVAALLLLRAVPAEVREALSAWREA